MTLACNAVNGINLAQGICDCPLPLPVGAGAKEAIDNGINTYTRYDGLAELRAAIAGKYQRFYGMSVDSGGEIVVSCGATGAFYCACLALLNPGDEVIVFEPYYGYHINTFNMMGARRQILATQAAGVASFEDANLPRTCRGAPGDPRQLSGKSVGQGVFQGRARDGRRDRAKKHDLWVFTDEIYEHFVYDGLSHVPIARFRACGKER